MKNINLKNKKELSQISITNQITHFLFSHSITFSEYSITFSEYSIHLLIESISWSELFGNQFRSELFNCSINILLIAD